MIPLKIDLTKISLNKQVFNLSGSFLSWAFRKSPLRLEVPNNEWQKLLPLDRVMNGNAVPPTSLSKSHKVGQREIVMEQTHTKSTKTTPKSPFHCNDQNCLS